MHTKDRGVALQTAIRYTKTYFILCYIYVIQIFFKEMLKGVFVFQEYIFVGPDTIVLSLGISVNSTVS